MYTTELDHLESLGLGLGEAFEETGSIHGGCPRLPLPLRQGLARPMPCGQTTQQQCFTNSSTPHPRQFDSSNWLGQLVCWWFWARSATLLLCRCYFGPAWLQQRQGAVALLLLRCLVSTRSMPRYVTLPSSRLSIFSSFKTTSHLVSNGSLSVSNVVFPHNNIHICRLQQ